MELSSEQRALRDTVRDLLRRRSGSASDEEATWRSLCATGAPGLAVPERFGGSGAGPVEVSIVAYELGRVLARTPLLGSAVLTTSAILAAGDERACERLLPALAEGTATGALAWTGQDGGWDPGTAAFRAAEPGAGNADQDGAWALSGAAHYVLDGDQASVLIAAAALPGGQVGLFEVDPGQPGADRQPSATMDQTRRLAVVRLDAAAGRPIRPGHDLEASGALAAARDVACIALAAEQAGAAARALEVTVGYTGTRVQFGRAIASFQAIQHRLADLHVLVESARALAFRAAAVAADAWPAGATGAAGTAWGGGAGRDGQLSMLAAAAKAYCSEALATVAGEMIQLHGAIGATWEHDAHRYFKRAHGSGQLFGAPPLHLARIAQAVIGE